MQARIATQHFFNPETQRALLEKGNGYVNKEEGMRDRIAQIRREHKPEKIAMLNLGENPDGCAPGLQEWIQDQAAGTGMRSYLGGYPESQSNELRVKLSILHNINPEWIMVAAGLDQLIGMIASCFIEPRDRFLVTNPGFFLFEEYCCRLGGVPVELNLPESKGFAWTDDVMEACDEIIRNVNLKLIWIANPNNPTGRRMDDEMLESLVALARARLITVVVDEAYGEYTDPSYGVRSASRLLVRFDNLIVLRTFSKAWGLAGLRIAYALSRNPAILAALQVHRAYFPVTRLSLDLACRSLENIHYLDEVRRALAARRGVLAKSLAGLPGINLVDSDAGIGMLRCLGITAADLMDGLEKEGVIVAPVPGEGVAASQYVRFTYSRPEELSWLAQGLGRVIKRHLGW
jgi:histidinol-phosphate aminotransferase